MVPLLELMTNKAMKPRHWNRMAEVTGHVFDIESDNFTLRNILQAPLLEFKEDIEVYTAPDFFSQYLSLFTNVAVILGIIRGLDL